MNVLSRLYNRIRPNPYPSANGGGFALMRFVPEGLRYSEEEALTVSSVWCALRAIVDPLASSEWVPFTTGEQGHGRKNLPDGSLFYILNMRANRDLPAQAAKELALTQTILSGNGYAYLLRDNANRIIGWQPLDSDRVEPVRDPQTDRLYYQVTQSGAETEYVPDADIIHLRGPCVRGLTGDSLVYRAAKAIALAIAQEKYATVYYQNGASIGGYIKLPSALKDQAAVDRLKASWNEKNAGLKNAHGTAVLENGAEYVALSPDAEKTQLVQARTFQLEEIARHFNLPLAKLRPAGVGANIAPVQSANEEFVRETLRPWAFRISQEVGFKMLPQRAPWPQIEVDLTWLTRGDESSRITSNEVAIRSGQLTINEARAREGRPAVKGGDTLLVQNQPLDRILAPPKPPPAPPPAPAAQPHPGQLDPTEEDGPEDESATNCTEVARVLAAHAKRVKARREYLAKEGSTAEVVAKNVAGLLDRARKDLAALVTATPEAITTALESVEHVAPEVAAKHLLGETV